MLQAVCCELQAFWQAFAVARLEAGPCRRARQRSGQIETDHTLSRAGGLGPRVAAERVVQGDRKRGNRKQAAPARPIMRLPPGTAAAAPLPPSSFSPTTPNPLNRAGEFPIGLPLTSRSGG